MSADPVSESAHEHARVLEVLSAYLSAIDRRDWPAVVGCFADDAQSRYEGAAGTLIGGAQVAQFVQAATVSTPSTVHNLANTHISTEDVGTVRATSFAIVHALRPADGILATRAIRYDDTLRHVHGRWFITARAHRALWQIEQATVPPQLILDALRFPLLPDKRS
ncbi:nuclear transport factor 2 family protein [Microbacterium sp.]|uniref:nuclear transport factor 2 family protein n=1 Tax=Microbacterium sp. TaxID=51671 RepID=UPI0039E26FB2